jgi:hypothetical protein
MKRLLFLFFLFSVSASSSFAGYPSSPALTSLLEQCQQTFLAPKGTNLEELSMKHSLVNVAVLLGFGMQIQKGIAGSNPFQIKRFEALERDVFTLLDWMVKYKNYTDNNGKSIRFNDLKLAYQKAFDGSLNKFSQQNYGIRISSVRHTNVLEKKINSPVEAVVQSNGSELNMNPKDNRFDFLGLKHGEKQTKAWPKLKKFGPDMLVGDWFSNTDCKIYRGSFRKTRTGYSGEVSNPNDSNAIWSFEVKVIRQDWENPKNPYFWYITYGGYAKYKDLKPQYVEFSIRPFRETWMIRWEGKGIYVSWWGTCHRPL